VSDVDFLLTQWRTTLMEFKNDYDKWEKYTLGDYVAKCGEIIRNQIENNMLDMKVSGISSYLYSQLDKEGIVISARTIQRNLPDIYKQNYLKSDTLSQLEEDDWQPIETNDPSLTIEKNQFNDIKINGVEQKAKEVKKKQETQAEESFRLEPKDTRQFTYLTAMSKLANKFHLTLETLKNRYNESDEIQGIIDKELGDVEGKLEQYAKDWASIENSKGMIDLRRDFGEYEKVVACFNIEVGETIARVAQLMDYSEKYGSIGILREPKVREFFEKESTYPLYLRSCPKCLTDIAQIMNHNINLYRECKDLSINIPRIKYNQ
jgi:hypothetical protein